MSNTIISASNEGSRYLVSGEYSKSIEYLAAAFDESRHDVLRAAKTDDVWEENKKMMRVAHQSCWIIDHWMEAPNLTNEAGDVDTQSMYIYSSPIIVPSNSIEDISNDLLLVNVIVSFNLGLAFLESARYGTNNTSEESNHRLLQALKLFQYSFRLQRARGKTPQSPLFFMATVNNIGFLYATLGEIHHAKECFQQLLALLMYMNTNQTAEQSSNYGVFLQNSTVMMTATSTTNKNSNHMSACVGAAGAA